MAQPLRRQTVTIAAVLFVAVYAALFYASRLTYREHLRQLEVETSTMAATVVVYLNQYLETADVVSSTASRHPAVAGLDSAAAPELLRPLLAGRRRLVHNVVLADPSGAPVTWAEPPDPALESLIDRAWLAGVAQAGQPAMSPMMGGPGDPAHIVVLAYPIPGPNGRVAGVFGLSVHLEALEHVLSSIPLPAGSVVTLTDDKSVVVARSLDARRYVGRPIEAPGQLRKPEDVPVSVVRTGVDGVERVFGNAVLERGPWLASVGIPTTVAMARTRPVFVRNLGISVATTLFVVVFTLVLVRRWLAAFGHLEGVALRVARGDLSPLDQRPMPSAEMAHLQGTIRGMITSLSAARASIASQVDEERRMREEVQSLQQQVIRQERLAAIGVLVSGVAHELNNPLQAILGFAELLQMQPNMPEQAKADLVLIQKESTRASAIIRNLSRFGRQVLEPSPVRYRDVVASVMELRQRKLEELGIDVRIDERSTGTVLAIFTELQQVLLNFAINAEQAIVLSGSPRKQITIRTGDRDGYAWVEIEDSGPGVPAEDEAKLFQPFHTTKPVGEGTGLGLSVSYDIIRMHGGRIGYRPSPAGGAVFYFELPIVPGSTGSTGS